jgi:hypothetical protein
MSLGGLLTKKLSIAGSHLTQTIIGKKNIFLNVKIAWVCDIVKVQTLVQTDLQKRATDRLFFLSHRIFKLVLKINRFILKRQKMKKKF